MIDIRFSKIKTNEKKRTTRLRYYFIDLLQYQRKQILMC